MKPLIIIILLFTSIGFSHQQHVHKYLTTEAYKLLKLQFGYDIPKLLERIGGTSEWYNGDEPWSRGYITTGAYREDEDDVVYGYSKSAPPTLTGVSGVLYSIISIFGGLTPGRRRCNRVSPTRGRQSPDAGLGETRLQ